MVPLDHLLRRLGLAAKSWVGWATGRCLGLWLPDVRLRNRWPRFLSRFQRQVRDGVWSCPEERSTACRETSVSRGGAGDRVDRFRLRRSVRSISPPCMRDMFGHFLLGALKYWKKGTSLNSPGCPKREVSAWYCHVIR